MKWPSCLPIPFFLLLLVWIPSATAETRQTEMGDIKLAIVSDETVTPFGHSLASAISARWYVTGESLQQSVSVIEKPSPLRGSLIEIDSGGKTLFSGMFQPRRTNTEQLAQQLVPIIQKKLLALQFESLTKNPDLIGDGLH